MGGTTSGKKPVSRRWTAGVLALGIVTAGAVGGDVRVLPPPPRVEAATAAPKYDLESLRATALMHNAAIAAAKGSLASAAAGRQGVENIRVPTCLQPDLPYRRKQACLGVQAAEAGVRQAELLVVFGVQYAYVSYLFARTQERLADEAARNSADLSKSVRDVLKDVNVKTDLKESDALLLEGVHLFAESKLTEARMGSRRALSALREAVGVGEVPLALDRDRLPAVAAAVDQGRLIGLALANRPDLLAASINVQVSDLEVQAQRSRRTLNLRTFASGADLHANPLPAGRYDQEYRPGVSGPEMPPFISGKKEDRVARAAALAGRAASVRDKAQALIVLEVEQACLRYEEATAKRASLTHAAAKLEGPVDAARNRLRNAGFGEDSKAVLDDLLKFGQLYSQVRVQANEARYQQLIALITLERATGAAFRADISRMPEVKDE